MEQPHDGVSHKDETGDKKSQDEFYPRDDPVLPRALQVIMPRTGDQAGWQGTMPAGSRFFDTLGKLVSFYDKLARPPRDAGHETGISYSGTIIVETNHHGTGNVIAEHLATAASDHFQVYELGVVPHGTTGAKRDDDTCDAMEHVRLNAPAIMIITGDGVSNHPVVNIIHDADFRTSKVIIVVLVDDLTTIPKIMSTKADFILHVDRPTLEERSFYVTYLLGADPCVDHGLLAGEMDGWTWDDIDKYCKYVVFQQHLSGMNDLSTKFLLDLLHGNDDLQTFIPPSMACKEEPREPGAIDDHPGEGHDGGDHALLARPVLPGGFCDPFEEQMWQVAASCDYQAVSKMLEHIERGTITPEDKPLLVKYPFVLREGTITARTLLDAAKNKVDLLSRTFKARKG